MPSDKHEVDIFLNEVFKYKSEIKGKNINGTKTGLFIQVE